MTTRKPSAARTTIRAARKRDPEALSCPIASALELIGDGWTLLILREAFRGRRHFADVQRELGIAKNVLSQRLSRLVEGGVLERRPSTQDRRTVEYRLTDAGKELSTVLVAIAQWGDRYLCGGRAPLRLVNRHTGARLAPLTLHDVDGVALTPRDLLDLDALPRRDAA